MLFLRRRLVRLHLKDQTPSLEGYLTGIERGHYRLLKPSYLESPERTHELTGDVWVPRANVLFVQRLEP